MAPLAHQCTQPGVVDTLRFAQAVRYPLTMRGFRFFALSADHERPLYGEIISVFLFPMRGQLRFRLMAKSTDNARQSRPLDARHAARQPLVRSIRIFGNGAFSPLPPVAVLSLVFAIIFIVVVIRKGKQIVIVIVALSDLFSVRNLVEKMMSSAP